MNTTPDSNFDATLLASTLADDCNCTITAVANLDEDGLPDGIPGGKGDAPGMAIMATGNLGYSFGANGPAVSGAFAWNLNGLPTLTSGGEDISFALSSNGQTLVGSTDDGATVLTLAVTDVANGDYKLTLSKPLDHPISGTEDNLIFSFDYTITDSDGDQARARMVVDVDDDTPTISVDAPSSVEQGDSITGTWSVEGGADGIANTAVTLPDDSTQYALNTPIDTGLGTLVVKDDGTWTFTAEDGLDLSQDPKLIFNITTTDGDGDTADCFACIPIVDGTDGIPTTPETDGDPATSAATAIVDEDGLPGGIAGGVDDVAGEHVAAAGILGYDFGEDGPAASDSVRWSTEGLPDLTSGGSQVTWTLNGNGRSLNGFDANGERVIAIQLTNLDTGAYKVTLLKPLDHADPNSEDDITFSVGYTVTDSDGDTAQGNLNVVIDDDMPVVVDDAATTDSDTPVTVDVLDNDKLGADGGDLTDASVQGGPGVGTVTVNPDGTLTFVPNPDFSGNASIDYTVTDGDGDTVDGHLTVTVEGGDSVPTTPETDGDPNTKAATAVVDEDGLPGGIAGGVDDVPGESVVATGTLGYDFGDDGQGGFSWSTEGLPTLTSRGDAITYSLSGNGRSLVGFDSNGDRVLSVQLTNVATGAYKVVLAQPLDHADATSEDDIAFSVRYTITDGDGDSAAGRLNVVVDDDTPVSAADTATTDSDSPVTVDVLTNDQLGADGGKLTNATVQDGADVGTVKVNPDGTLTFTPDPDFSGDAVIDYTVTDGDGDPVEGQLTVTVEGGDSVPTTPETDGDPATNPARAVVDEDGLPGGVAGGIADVAGEPTVAIGTLGYAFGEDGPAASDSVRWTTDGLPDLTSGGSQVTWTLNGNGRSLNGFDANGERVIAIQLTNLDTGAYKVTLLKPLDHARADIEDDIAFSVGYTVTDSDGDTASGKLNIIIDDDTPVASDDVASGESGSPITVDVLENDQLGADGGKLTNATVQDGTDVGTVKVNPDGTLTFTPNPDFSGDAVIDYTATDGDGDPVDGKLTVTVEGDSGPTTPETDGDPATNPAKAVVDEDGLPGGIAGGIADVAGEPIVAKGTLGYDFGDDGPAAVDPVRWTTDDLPDLTSGGSPVTWTLNGNGRSLIGTDGNGDRVIAIQLTNPDTGAYKVTLMKPLDHARADIEDDIAFSVGYTVTDSDGDTASGVLNVVIDDDTPVANDDSASTDSDTPITVDVLGNDKLGADGGSLTGATVQGGPSVGTVTTAPDGSLTFTPNPDFSGDAVIDYTATDGDGDPVDGTLSVAVEEGGDVPTTPETDDDPSTQAPTAIVDEDGLPGGVAGGNGDVPGEAVMVTGSLGYDFGDDGPATTGAFAWDTSGLPSLTANGSPITYTVSNNGKTLLGLDSSFDRVISVQLTDQATGAYKVVLAQPLDHSDPTSEDDIAFAVGYTVTDSDGDSAAGKLNIVIDDDTPVAGNDSVVTPEDTPITVDVLENDAFGADGGNLDDASVQGGNSVGTVTLNPDSTLTFTPTPGFEGNAVIDYTGVDGDGDPLNGTLTVSVGDDSVPTTPETDGNPDTQSPTATLDEDGLPGGISGGIGDVAGDAVTATGTLGYAYGDDGPAGSNAFSWTTTGLPELTSGGQPISYSVSADGLTLSGLDGDDNTVFTVALTNLATGAYAVTLLQPLDHSDPTSEDDITLSVGYSVRDGDGDQADGKLTVVVDDDRPTAFAAEPLTLEDGAEGSTGFVDHAGADGVGDVIFTDAADGEPALDANGNPLMLDGQALTQDVSADGKVITATTAGGDVAFTLTLADDGNSYSIETNGDIASGTAVSQNAATGTPIADGDFIFYNRATGATSADVLVSSSGSGTPSKSGDALSVTDGGITTDERLRFDFIKQVSVSSNTPVWSDHQAVTQFQQVVSLTTPGSATSIKVAAVEYAPDSGLSGGNPHDSSGALLKLDASNFVVQDKFGVDVTDRVEFEVTDDGVILSGLRDGWNYELVSDTPFEAVQVTGASEVPFSLGDFGYRVGGSASEVTLSYELEGTDGDGDLATGSLDLTLPGDDQLYVGGNVDNTKETGAGGDVLIGDVGDQTGLVNSREDYNITIIMDESSSMGKPSGTDNYSRFRLQIEGINNYLETLSTHNGTINIQIVRFTTGVTGVTSVNDLSESNLADLQSFVSRARRGGGTNYEAALTSALSWQKSMAAANDFDSFTMFLTDGLPTTYTNSRGQNIVGTPGNITALSQAHGKYLELLEYSDVHVLGIGEQLPNPQTAADLVRKDYLDIFDNTDTVDNDRTITLEDGRVWTSAVGDASIVNNVEDLAIALANGTTESIRESELGNDTLSGGAGDDIIFGDAINTDDLTWTNGDSGQTFAAGDHDGLGYEGLFEFLKWSADHGDGVAPSDEQVLEYLRENYESLMETTSEDGGDDTLRGGQGDDVIIAGGGLDLIDGGAGDDLMWGNAGSDTFAWSAGDGGASDQPAADTIRDFTLGEVGVDANADKLDLSDLLDGATEADVSDYLVASQEGNDVVLAVKSSGGISADGANADQTITLTGVDLGGNGEDFINNLINNGQLDVE
ncbi:T1SS-143 repeat domain-containing protein [Halomonas sp. V046]|uniref:T1SS-143 repeat domain-containing protein n=1 Tax=Halomonas sp. V046 TaxID=3459611 RepID=UPI0040448441